MTIAPLPASVHHRLAAVTRTRLTAIANGATLSGADDAPDQPPGGSTVRNEQYSQMERFILPHGSKGTDCVWLHLSAVDPCALQMCARLAETVYQLLGEPAQGDAFRSPHVQQSDALDLITGRWRLAQALEEMLARGYAQGLDALCRVHLQQRTRIRAWRVPVIEIRGQNGHLEGIRVCWIPVKPPTVEPSPRSQKASKAPRKRHSRRAGKPSSPNQAPRKRQAR